MTERHVPPLNDKERAAFIDAARSFLGVRFRHQGRTRDSGLDCAGVIAASMAAIGKEVLDIVGYPRDPYKAGLESVLVANFGPMLPADEMQVGDIALMSFNSEPRHIGVLAPYRYGGLMLVHSFAQVKKVVEHRVDDEWRGYIVGVYRP